MSNLKTNKKRSRGSSGASAATAALLPQLLHSLQLLRGSCRSGATTRRRCGAAGGVAQRLLPQPLLRQHKLAEVVQLALSGVVVLIYAAACAGGAAATACRRLAAAGAPILSTAQARPAQRSGNELRR